VRSWRFLLSTRWVVFALIVALLAYLAWWLGEWQFGRLDQRRHDNAVIERNEKAAPEPVDDVLAAGRAVSADDEWRLITATGTYDTDDTIIVRYRTRKGTSGVEVVVPLVTAHGTALLVDRGWMRTENTGSGSVAAPEPPSGEVTIEGWVRADATGRGTEVDDRSTRAISSEEIGAALDREVYGGFLELKSEDPPPAEALRPVELPDLGEGPHFFYGLQWWFFGVLAVFGFGYLLYDEWRGNGPVKRERGAPSSGRRPTFRDRLDAWTAPPDDDLPRTTTCRRTQSEREIPPSTGSITPVSSDAAGESTNAATPTELVGLAIATQRDGLELTRLGGGRVSRGLVEFLHPIGRDSSRQQTVDPDPARADLVGQVLGEHRQPGPQAVGDGETRDRVAHRCRQDQRDRAAVPQRSSHLAAQAYAPPGTPSRNPARQASSSTSLGLPGGGPPTLTRAPSTRPHFERAASSSRPGAAGSALSATRPIARSPRSATEASTDA
jgi:cytochrome oxidase assembly protein ShyY1